MRLTVGPLQPAVYWRRRAVVLGAGLLFLIVLLYSCTGPDRSGGGPQAGSTSSASPPAGASPGPAGSVLTPQSGGPGSPPSGAGATDPSPETTSNVVPSPVEPAGPAGNGTVDDGTCTNAEISVTPVVAPTSAPRGGVVNLELKIKNVSNRTCSRDVGADLQELFVKSGAEKVWSSDTCGKVKGSDVQSFTPGFERSYEIGWNGRDTSRCDASGLAAGPYAPAGSYQVFARVGTKLSEPVKLTVTG